jgi:lipopolysaccharide export system protein LptA
MCGFAQAAVAERADRSKPIHLEADRVTLDDARQMAVFTGDVRMTQGTLSISADQVVATQGPNGFEHGTATGAPAQFRQKRDGSDEYVEGSGQRIEYDAITGAMDIYGQAHVRRGLDDVRGEHITYNTHDQSFRFAGGQTPTEKKRVTVTINPRTPPPSAVEPAEPLTIKPDTRLINQDDKQ